MITSGDWMENARLRLEAARLLFDEGFYGESLTRAYYAMFAAAKALLAVQGHRARGHKGVHILLFKVHRDEMDTSLFHTAWADREDYDYRLKMPNRAYAAQRLAGAAGFLETAAFLLES